MESWDVGRLIGRVEKWQRTREEIAERRKLGECFSAEPRRPLRLDTLPEVLVALREYHTILKK